MSDISSGAPASPQTPNTLSPEAAPTKELAGKISAKAEAAKAKAAGTTQSNMSQSAPKSGQSAVNEALEAQGLESEDSSSEDEVLESEQVKASKEPKEDNEEDSEEESEEESEKKPKEKEKKEPKKFTIKVDGKEETLSEEEMVRRVQKATKAEKSIQEASELKKGITEFLKDIQSNPKKVLKELGIDPIMFAQKTIEEEIEHQSKSPEQLELEAARKEIEDIRAKQKAEKEEKEALEQKEFYEKIETDLENDLITAIDSSGLRKSPALLKKVADIMLVNLNYVEENPNGKMISAQDAVKMARLELASDLKEILSSGDDSHMEQFLGEDLIKRIRKHAISKVKTAAPTASQVKQTGNSPTQSQPVKKINFKDFIKMK